MSAPETVPTRSIEHPWVVAAMVVGWLAAFYLGARFDRLYVIFGGYAFGIFLLTVRLFRFDLKPPRGPSLLGWLGGVAFGVVGVLVAHLIFGLFQSELPFLAAEVKVLFSALAPTGPFDIVAMGFVIVAEELLFRGLLQRVLERVFSAPKKLYAVCTLQIVVYALAQMGTASVSVFMAGLVLGIGVTTLYKWSGSLWPAIVGHALWTYGVVVVFPLL